MAVGWLWPAGLPPVRVELSAGGWGAREGSRHVRPQPWRPRHRVAVGPLPTPRVFRALGFGAAGRYRLRVVDPWRAESENVDVDFDAAPEQAAALAAVLEAWREASAPSDGEDTAGRRAG